MSFVSSILGGAKDEIKNGLSNAASSLGQLDVAGAVSSLTDIPGNLLASISRGGVALGDGFKGIRSRQDAVQDWCWYCVLPDVGGKSLPWYYVTTANTPHRKFNVESLKRNGHEIHLVESYGMGGNIQLKFFLDASSKSHAYLKAWCNEILWDHDPSLAYNQGVWGYPSAYKKTITIVVMSVDKKDLLVFKYFGCFPTDPQALELTPGTPTPLELTVEFQVEDVELTVKNGMGFLENLKETVKGFALGALTGGISSVISSFKATPSGLDSVDYQATRDN